MKQRLVGAAVLVALAVIFLPMLVQGPAPDSGASDVPLSMPNPPASDYQTRDLPLMGPGAVPEGGAVGMDAGNSAASLGEDGQVASITALPGAEVSTAVPLEETAPTPSENEDAAELAQPATVATESTHAESITKLPAATAAGDYAVSFGAFGSIGAADRIVAALRAAQLPGYRESASADGKPVQRVRIGPFATRADAELARQRALQVRDDISAQVVVLDAEVAAAPTSAPAGAKPTAPKPAPAESKTSTLVPAAKPTTAAANVGFAVQIGAFTRPADAIALRDKARAAGFSAFTETVGTDSGTLTRVRIGPVVSRAEADQLKAQVRAKLGTDGIVRPHP